MNLIPARQIVFALMLFAPVAQAMDFAQHPVIKLYIGKWTAEGELKNPAGDVTTVSQTWEGKVDGDNAFLIEGKRTVNNEEQSYRWSFTHNAATDLIESTLMSQDGNQLRFEVQASEADLSVTLKAVTGSGMGSIGILDTFTGEDKDTLVTKVTFTGDQGETTLEGTITGKREKAP